MKEKKTSTKENVYKKVAISLEDNEGNVTIQCIHLKSDESLQVGDFVNVRGELKRRNSMLEFGNGCACVKVYELPASDAEAVAALRNLPEGELYAGGFCALTGTVTVVEKVPNTLPQTITHLIGALTMFLVGIIYMFMADLTINSSSSNLIISTLLAFGSAILFFLSISFNEKPALMYVFKAIGLLLAIGFVAYMHYYQGSEEYLKALDKFIKQGISGEGKLLASKVTMVISLVFGYIAAVAQCANIVVVAVLKED